MSLLGKNKKLTVKISPVAASVLLACSSVSINSLAQDVENVENVEKKSAIEVIEVTSTKRKTTLMETGQAVSAFNETAMEEKGIEDSQDLVRYSPSLIMTSSKFSIRCVGRLLIWLGL